MELEKQIALERNDENEPGNIDDLPTEPNRQSDLRPEFCDYRDEGCEMAGSCLNCPFTLCKYDEPGERQRLMRISRAKEIVRLHGKGKRKRVKELAEMFGVSERTVQRILKAVMGNSNSSMTKCHSEEVLRRKDD